MTAVTAMREQRGDGHAASRTTPRSATAGPSRSSRRTDRLAVPVRRAGGGPSRVNVSSVCTRHPGGSSPRRRRRTSPIAVGPRRPVTPRARLDVANVASWLRSQAPKSQPMDSGRPLTCPTRPAASRGCHPRPIASDRHARQKPRRQDVLRPMRVHESVAVARCPVASGRSPVASRAPSRSHRTLRSPYGVSA